MSDKRPTVDRQEMEEERIVPARYARENKKDGADKTVGRTKQDIERRKEMADWPVLPRPAELAELRRLQQQNFSTLGLPNRKQ